MTLKRDMRNQNMKGHRMSHQKSESREESHLLYLSSIGKPCMWVVNELLLPIFGNDCRSAPMQAPGLLPDQQPPGPLGFSTSLASRWRSICWRRRKTEVGLKPLLYLSCFQSYLGNLIISNADVLQCSEISYNLDNS